jgi:hypothetical protein
MRMIEGGTGKARLRAADGLEALLYIRGGFRKNSCLVKQFIAASI